jgi:futalosine hydrolase
MRSQPEWLVFTPTQFEMQSISFADEEPCVETAVCGFGPILSAAVAAERIAACRPKRVMLVGLAGTYSDRCQVGSAFVFRNVVCHGIGAGQGQGFQSAQELNWDHWNDDLPIGGCCPLRIVSAPTDQVRDCLVTVCSASASGDDLALVKRRFPQADAEDMEGYSVAAAAAVYSRDLTIVRGISNAAGDRNHANWKIEQALLSAHSLALQIIRGVGT